LILKVNMIAFYIFKVFFKTENGAFRYYFLFPLLSCLIGSYIIFMTLSIMEGMENNIVKRFKAFNYSTYISNLNNDEVIKLYDDKIITNEGFERISILNNDYSQSTIVVKNYKNLNKFLKNNLTSKYMIDFDSKIEKDCILIGLDLAEEFNLNIGDDVLLSSPIDVNLSTRLVPSKRMIVSGIFNLGIYDYDSRYVITSESSTKDIYLGVNNINYYLNEDINSELSNSYKVLNDRSFNNVLISAINFEKKIYSFLGFFIIGVTFLMLFSIMTLSIIEKYHQITILNILGLRKIDLYLNLIKINVFFSLIFSIIGFFLSELTLYANSMYGMFNLLFEALPFNILPNQLNVPTVSFFIIFLSLFIGVSSSIPIFFKREESAFAQSK